MKLINFSFLTKKEQRKEKSLLLDAGDVIHVLIDKRPDTEFIITYKDDKLKILPKEEFYNKKRG